MKQICSHKECLKERISRKLFCYEHYIYDLEQNLDKAKDLIFDYEKQVIPELKDALVAIRAEVGTSTKAWKIASDTLDRHNG